MFIKKSQILVMISGGWHNRTLKLVYVKVHMFTTSSNLVFTYIFTSCLEPVDTMDCRSNTKSYIVLTQIILMKTLVTINFKNSFCSFWFKCFMTLLYMF